MNHIFLQRRREYNEDAALLLTKEAYTDVGMT